MLPVEIETLIGNYAFPVVITVYLLWERRVVIDSLRTSIEANTKSTDKLIDILTEKKE